MGISFATGGFGTIVGDSGLVLRTTDGGVTWSKQTSGTPYPLSRVALSAPDTGTAVGALGVVIRTTNGGAT